jgi:hypothetical protein
MDKAWGQGLNRAPSEGRRVLSEPVAVLGGGVGDPLAALPPGRGSSRKLGGHCGLLLDAPAGTVAAQQQ